MARTSPENIAWVVQQAWQEQRPCTRREIAARLGVKVSPWLIDKIQIAMDMGWLISEIRYMPNGLPVYVYYPTYHTEGDSDDH